MKDVATGQPHRGSLAQRGRPTDRAKVFCGLPVEQLLGLIDDLGIVLGDAGFFETGQTGLFVAKALAHVTAGQDLDTALGQLGHAVLGATALFEGGYIGIELLLDLLPTDAAFARVLVVLGFLAGHAHVVWSALAVRTEVLLTGGAAHAELSHVIGGRSADHVSALVLLLIVGLGRLKHDNAGAVAAHHPVVKCDAHFHLLSVDLAQLFAIHEAFGFVNGDGLVAAQTAHVFELNFLAGLETKFDRGEALFGVGLEAWNVELMVALSRKKHFDYLSLLVLLTNRLVAVRTAVQATRTLVFAFFFHFYVRYALCRLLADDACAHALSGRRALWLGLGLDRLAVMHLKLGGLHEDGALSWQDKVDVVDKGVG